MSNPTTNATGDAGPSFEDALRELQRIVADLEEGTLGLEESMQRFEKGVGLLRQCHQTLERAEQKIQILTRMDPNCGPVTEDFDGTATLEQTQSKPKRRVRRPAAGNGAVEPASEAEED